MTTIDPSRLFKSLNRLLRHPPKSAGVTLDHHGWADLERIADAMGRFFEHEIDVEFVRALVAEGNQSRFELEATRIRLSRSARAHNANMPPDILYHATTTSRVERILQSGQLTVGRNRNVYLSTSEAQAWRVAHRLENGRPQVLYVDSSRARRRGVRLIRNRRTGLYVARTVPLSFILNLQDNFAKQHSAGGLPIVEGDDGVPRIALIRVTRKSGITWEVAKGKLEPGEVPERTAVREVQEEMGIECDMTITRFLGEIRYGFAAPGGLPRLKIVYLYLMSPCARVEGFHPSEREGIGDVRWFTPDEACAAVTHSSLIPLMYHARRILNEGSNHANRTPG